MKFHTIALAVLCMMTGTAYASQTIDFENLPFPGGDPTAYTYLQTGYQGFNWGGGFGAESWVVSPNDATGWNQGSRQPYSHTGNNFAWSNGGTALELTAQNGNDFELINFWARTWPNENRNITAHGYLQGNEIFTQSFSLTDTYAQITLNFSGIDRFYIDAQNTNILIDDINVSAVPIPTAAWLFGSVILGFAGLKRRSSNA